MKVLYVLAHYPQNSESYVDAEMTYMRSQGVQIEVWSPTSGYGDSPTVHVHRRSLAEALIGFAPDVIHIHHLTTATYYLDILPRGRATVRAHSFDWDLDRAKQVVSHPSVRRVFAFPNLAATAPGLGLVPLPVAFNQDLYYRVPKTRSVVRVAAGLLTKRLEDFLVVGNDMHQHYANVEFTLAINLVVGKESRVSDMLEKINASLGGHVRILKNLSRASVSELVRQASVYMMTCDEKSHAFGMPISIAEAMSSGALVIAPSNAVGVHDYMGDAGLFYSSTLEAMAIIEVALAMNDIERDAAAAISRRCAERFRSDVVLPRLLQEWESIRSGKSN
jgi:glycosyltransferase involved in cell wall biosynthesis